MQGKDKDVSLRISDAVIEDGGLWASCDDFNGLLYFDFEKKRAVIIDEFPGISLSVQYAFSCVVRAGDVLVFVPGSVNAIYTYHTVQRIFQKYLLPEELREETYSKFAQAYVYDCKVYMIGYSKACILCFDTLRNSITYYNNFCLELQGKYRNEFQIVDKEVCRLGSKLFFPPRNGDCIIEFDMAKQQLFFHDFGYKGDIYVTLCYDDGFFWSYGIYNQIIVQIDDKFEVKNEISMSSLFQGNDNDNFRFSYKKGKHIWLFSNQLFRYVKIDISERKMEIGTFDGQQEKTSYFSYSNIKSQDGHIYVFEPEKRGMYRCDEVLDQTEKVSFDILQDDINSYIKKGKWKEIVQGIQWKEIIYENEYTYLDGFLKHAFSGENLSVENKHYIGNDIYKKI